MAHFHTGYDIHTDSKSCIIYDIPNYQNQQIKPRPVEILQCPDIYSTKLETDSIRIVHISDTHLNHNNYFKYVPNGDILIHSGDFFNLLTLNSNNEITETNLLKDFFNFFNNLPHKYKIFVAGNHESDLATLGYNDICKALSINNKNIIYLQDSSVNLYGINIYGTPFNESKHIKPFNDRCIGFSIDTTSLIKKWNNIPLDTDILITHQPPYNIMDYAKGYSWNKRIKCLQESIQSKQISNLDQLYFQLYEQWGDPYLTHKILNDIKPLAHLFGHAHRSTGYVVKNDVLFVNSAMNTNKTMHFFDVKQSKDCIKKQSKL